MPGLSGGFEERADDGTRSYCPACAERELRGGSRLAVPEQSAQRTCVASELLLGMRREGLRRVR
jgi:hypothetical protein